MNRQIDLPSFKRAAEVVPSSIQADDRSVEVVWSTGARVRRQPFFGDPFDEELSMEPTSRPAGTSQWRRAAPEGP